MALTSGTRLGPYEIVAPIGAGGMGEVYRARDTRLDRTVAVKIAAEQFTERFEREARAVAALNHPNICTLHDVGPNYLVMEYVEGPTLAERIRAGMLPLEEALAIARQIAEALEAAHEKGIVHRDLKPANIKLTGEGKVKVLDFGLAAMASPSQVSADPASSPTLTLSATRAGMILGTAGYMSPEQARGQPADKRADIWAFGVVLYEMLTGRQVFLGETVSDTLAAVLRADLDWKALPAGTPAAVRRLLRRCLERDRKQRLHDIADARLELEEAPEAAAPVVREKSRWAFAAAAALALGFVILAAVHFRESPPAEASLQASVLPPPKTAFTALGPGGGGFAISPDGRSLAFSVTEEGRSALWIRRLDSLSARPLPGTENGAFPFWSPDSRFVAFFADNKLKRIEIAGGPPQAICDATGRGGSWNRDGIVVFTGTDRTVYRVRAAGGDPVKLTAFSSTNQENAHYWPYFLADGRRFIYYARSTLPGKSAVCVGSIDDKPDASRRIELVKAGTNAIYVPRTDATVRGSDGWLLFMRAATLFAQKIDAGKPALEGEAVPVAENVGYVSAVSLGNFSASGNGLLVYGHGADRNKRLVWIGRDGKLSAVAAAAAAGYGSIRLSPDESRLAALITEPQTGNDDVWQIELHSGVTTRFTFHPSSELAPVWSPDGKLIVFASFRDGAAKLYLKAASGAGDEERITQPSENAQFPFDWSRDGRYLLYREIAVGTGDDLWVIENPAGPAANRRATAFLKTPFNESQGCFSPDGRWVAYISDESSRYEVYVRSFTGAPAKFMISNGGGTHPRWRSDGKELYYVGRQGKMMAVPVKAGSGGFERGSPTELFDAHFVSSGGIVNYRYDVTRDGQRFLAAIPTEDETVQPLNMVIHWEAGLRR